MPAIPPLICAACGSQLKPTSDGDRYRCPRCGTEHLVERHGQPASAASSSSAAHVTTGAARPVPTPKRNTSSALIELHKVQIILLCAAPVLILMGMSQLITNQKILK